MLNLNKASCVMVIKSQFHTVVTACWYLIWTRLLRQLTRPPAHRHPDGTSTAPSFLPNPCFHGGSVRQLTHILRFHRCCQSGSCSSVVSPYFKHCPVARRLISSSSRQQCSTCWLLSECSLQLGVITACHIASSFIGREGTQSAGVLCLRSCNV